jgi:hypothetical protein
MVPMTDGPDWLGTLDEAEERLWAAFPYGSQVEYWHGEQIRAEVVAALALGAVPATPGRTAGVRMRGATVIGELDLRHGTVDVPLTMLSCTFTDSVRFEESSTKSIDLTGSHLLRICATGAHIRGTLDLSRARITGGGEDAALLQKLIVDTDLIGSPTALHGQAGPGRGAHRIATLNLNRAVLSHPRRVAANLGGAVVESSFYFTKATIEGHLRMPGLKVDGVLDMTATALTARRPTAGSRTRPRRRFDGDRRKRRLRHAERHRADRPDRRPVRRPALVQGRRPGHHVRRLARAGGQRRHRRARALPRRRLPLRGHRAADR